MNPALKQWLRWIAVSLMALIVVVVIVVNVDDDDGVAGDTTTTGAETTSSVLESITTVPDTTTTLSETTTSGGPETTTTLPPETTTSAPAPATTTTAAALVVELSDEGIQAGATWVYFGFDDEDAIASVASVLGPADDDSGWIDSFSPFGNCPGTVVRAVLWGDFVMLFTQADTDFWSGGVPHFFSYYSIGTSPNLFTTEGVGVGSSVETLVAAYGGPLFTMGEAFFDASVGSWTYDQESWTGLWGYATGQSEADTVTSINGGQGCGE